MIWAIYFTRAGILPRASTDDRGMVPLLGVNEKLIFTAVFAAGAFLAGMAGASPHPMASDYLLDTTIILSAFIVCVIGGLCMNIPVPTFPWG